VVGLTHQVSATVGPGRDAVIDGVVLEVVRVDRHGATGGPSAGAADRYRGQPLADVDPAVKHLARRRAGAPAETAGLPAERAARRAMAHALGDRRRNRPERKNSRDQQHQSAPSPQHRSDYRGPAAVAQPARRSVVVVVEAQAAAPIQVPSAGGAVAHDRWNARSRRCITVIRPMLCTKRIRGQMSAASRLLSSWR
jgi:hypothetical protein